MIFTAYLDRRNKKLMRTLLYYIFKIYVRIGLFFYSKKITILGKGNIPKKEAVLFTANHPNALIDPLLIATSIKRKIHFLVRAAAFKKRIIAYCLNLLGMMPIYRIRDGIKELSKNEIIFNNCHKLLKSNKTLLIFPEGSHNKKRTIRPLSKGFTRIIYGTIEKYPNLKIYIVPVGITYQNSSIYPSKVTIIFGKPILANNFYNTDDVNSSAKELKNKVSNQLKKLTVHIENDKNYDSILSKLNNAKTDFTNVKNVNSIIKKGDFSALKAKNKKSKSPLFYLLIINSFAVYLIWKTLSKKVNEIEFIDTFRFGLSIILLPILYSLQSFIIYLIFDSKAAVIYFTSSLLLALIYTKTETSY